jgi:predicted lipid-binding transport protein (Tim44 family)
MMVMEKPFGNVHMVGLLSEVWVDDENARRPSPSLIQVGSFMKNRSIKRMLTRTLSRRDSEELNTSDLGTPASLQALLDDCWANDLARRPSMVKVVDRMKDEIKAMNNTSNSNIATASDQASLTTKTSSSDICDGRVREGTAAIASS